MSSITVSGTQKLGQPYDTVTGSTGTDTVTLYDGGETALITLVETILGGVGVNVVTLGSTGSSVTIAALQSLTGGTGTDVL
ncbi:MAG: hypothetical protein ABT940_11580, partial [Alphaproteobacteria bacterium]